MDRAHHLPVHVRGAEHRGPGGDRDRDGFRRGHRSAFPAPGRRAGLHHRWNQAKPYYTAITVSTLVGVAINFIGINPIQALLGSSVLMGVLSPPLLVLLMLSAQRPKIMGEHVIGPLLTGLGWLVTAAMILNVAALAYTTFVAG